MIIDRKMRRKTIGGVKGIVQVYSMVKLPSAESGDKRNIIKWSERQEKKRKEIKMEQRKNK
jgi:hypothetical protein